MRVCVYKARHDDLAPQVDVAICDVGADAVTLVNGLDGAVCGVDGY